MLSIRIFVHSIIYSFDILTHCSLEYKVGVAIFLNFFHKPARRASSFSQLPSFPLSRWHLTRISKNLKKPTWFLTLNSKPIYQIN
jgi:hypothetical protein